MAAQLEATTKVFEQVLDNVKKTAEANMQAQQELLRQWTQYWPTSFPSTRNLWIDQVQQFQKQWAVSVTELMQRHREALDKQYRESIQSLEEAFRLTQSQDPAEFRRLAEELCRRSITCMKEFGENQMREIQSTFNTWLGLVTKSVS
jgi:hypothetical protein